MANGNIKGIIVEVGGNTQPLQQALKDVDKASSNTTKELSQINRALKFDPSNTTLLQQKFDVLQDAIKSTSTRLDALKQAQAEVERKFASGEIDAQTYRQFQREIEQTQGKLEAFKRQADNVDAKLNIQADTSVIDKVEASLKELGPAAKQAAREVGNALQTAGAAGTAAIGALVFGSDELNQALARLKTNASTAGFSLEVVEDGFKNLSAVTGDSRAAVETVSNLMATGFSDQQMTSVLEEITGAYIAFSDTLSAEGIADGIQETFGVGEAAGSFLELLERMGVDIDKFNEGLAKAKKNGEETDYVLQQLSDLGLKSNYEEYQKLNPEIAKNAEETMNMQLALAELAIVLTPLVTMVTELVTRFVEWATNNPTLVTTLAIVGGAITVISGAFAILGPIINGIITLWGPLSAFFTSLGTAITSAGGYMSFLSGSLSTLGSMFASLVGPIGLAIAAIVAIGAALVTAYNEVAWFRDGVNAIWNKIKEYTSTAFNAVKELVTSLISSTVEFSQEILSKFKAFWDENGAAITEIAREHFERIRSNIEMVMGIIKGIFEAVWPIISGVVKIAWEAIQLVVGSALDIILGIISATMKLLQGDWQGAWEAIKGIAEGIMNNIIKFFQDIDLLQIGKDIIQGLVDGIGSMVGAVKKKVEELAANIPEWAKKILGIKSPSRVFKQIGLWTGEGMVIGLDQSSPKVNKAMENIANGILDVSKAYQKEYSNLTDEFNKKNEDKQHQNLEKINKIQSEAAKKKRSLTQKEQREIARLEASYKDSTLKSEIEFQKKYQALVEKSEKEYLEVIKQYIEDKKSLNDLSIVEEAKIWEQSIELFVDGTNERIQAQKAYRDALNTINNEIVSINQQYSSKILEVNEELKKREEELTEAYKKAVDDRSKSLMNFTGLFEEFDVKFATSGTKLLRNLESQVDGFKTWQKEIEELAEKAIDEGLLEELRAMGPDALAEVMALNNMTDGELTKYSDLYKEKSQLARTQAASELEGLRLSNEATMKQLNAEAAVKLDELETEWKTSLQAITGAAEEEFGNMYDIGVNAAKGLEDGLKSMEPSLMSQARRIAKAIKEEIEDALDIHSPSRVMKGIGIFVGQGLIDGMDEMINKVSQSSSRLSDAVTNVYGSLANSAMKSANNSHAISQTQTSIDKSIANSYGDINVTIPVKDLQEFKSVVDFFNRLPQASRAR